MASVKSPSSLTSTAEETAPELHTLGQSPIKNARKHRPAPAPPRSLAALRDPTNDSTTSLPGGILAIDIDASNASSKPPMFSVRKQRSDSTDILETRLGLESHARSNTNNPGEDEPISQDIVRGVDSLHIHLPAPLGFNLQRSTPPSPLIPDATQEEMRTRRKAPPAPPKQRRKPPPAPSRMAGVASMSEMAQGSSMQPWAVVGGS
jgi:hypothetical protein